jgi:hypothetical protein
MYAMLPLAFALCVLAAFWLGAFVAVRFRRQVAAWAFLLSLSLCLVAVAAPLLSGWSGLLPAGLAALAMALFAYHFGMSLRRVYS